MEQNDKFFEALEALHKRKFSKAYCIKDYDRYNNSLSLENISIGIFLGNEYECLYDETATFNNIPGYWIRTDKKDAKFLLFIPVETFNNHFNIL